MLLNYDYIIFFALGGGFRLELQAFRLELPLWVVFIGFSVGIAALGVFTGFSVGILKGGGT